MKKINFLLISIIFGCLFFTVKAYSQDFNNEKVREFLITFLERDLLDYQKSTGDEPLTLFVLQGAQKAKYDVTVDDIFSDFSNNQLKAERKYKDVTFNVTGKISGVAKDYDGSPYVAFTPTQVGLPIVKAFLNQAGIEKAVEYDAGQIVKLQCFGTSETDGFAFQHCQEAREWPKNLKGEAEKIVDAFLTGKDVSMILEDRFGQGAGLPLFMFSYIANSSPPDSSCYNTSSIYTCSIMIKFLAQLEDTPTSLSLTPEYRKAYAKNKQFYHLP